MDLFLYLCNVHGAMTVAQLLLYYNKAILTTTFPVVMTNNCFDELMRSHAGRCLFPAFKIQSATS